MTAKHLSPALALLLLASSPPAVAAVAPSPAADAAATPAAAGPAPAETPPLPPENPALTAFAKATFAEWQSGKVDRSRYSSNMSAVLTDVAVGQVSSQVAALGAPNSFVLVQTAPYTQGQGGQGYVFKVVCDKATVAMALAIDKSGKIDGLYFRPWPSN